MKNNHDNLPNIIFIDGVPNQTHGGLTQTLYNLFDTYPSEKLYALVTESQITTAETSDSLSCKYILIKERLFGNFKKRFINKLNPFINKLNAISRDILGFKIDKSSLPANGLLLVCTTDPHKLHAAQIIHKKYGYQLITYFMDDWTADLKFNWWLGNVDTLAKAILDNSLGRLMISEWLNESLIERYSLVPKPTYVVHNPVTIKRDFSAPADIENVDVVKIIYAGSIWNMHLDGLVLVVDAIEKLNQSSTKKYELIIYSKPDFWEYNKAKLNKSGVVFGGFVLYDDLDEKLSKANLLLVTSSFAKEFAPFSKSSVQTKLTDYMKTGIPVLSVGPSYGACNKFVNKWQSGYAWDTLDTNKLADFLNNLTLDNAAYQLYAKNAYQAVESHFNKTVVQNELTEFILSLKY